MFSLKMLVKIEENGAHNQFQDTILTCKVFFNSTIRILTSSSLKNNDVFQILQFILILS